MTAWEREAIQPVFERDDEIRAKGQADTDQAGFSLIELLIVIVVLGILATVVIFGLTGATGKSAQTACDADAKSVELAVESYHTLHGTWPTAVQLTSPDVANNISHYLRTFPNATHYQIILAGGGEVDVQLPKAGNIGPPWAATATNYDTTPNPCASAS